VSWRSKNPLSKVSLFDQVVGDRDPVFEEEAQHFPRGVRSSLIGEGAGRAAPRPRVCGSMDFPMLKDCAPLGSVWIVRV
jgi:hypothetical protein